MVSSEIVEGDVAGYHYYPGRDRAIEWFGHELAESSQPSSLIRGFQDRQRCLRRSDRRGRVRHRSSDDEASTHLGAVSECTWETARLGPPGVHGPPLMDTGSVAVRPRITRPRRSGNRPYRPVTRCGGRHSCDPGLRRWPPSPARAPASTAASPPAPAPPASWW